MTKEDFLNMLAQCLEEGSVKVITDFFNGKSRLAVDKPDDTTVYSKRE